MTYNPGETTILLAEDDRIMRQIEIRTLNRLGFTKIIEAVNGEDAIEKLLENKSITIVISDWNMPKMNGIDLLTWIRTSPAHTEIPFIMATGQADKAHARKALEQGADGFVVKPFADRELKDAMDAALSPSPMDKPPGLHGPGPYAPRTNELGKPVIRVAHIQITDHLVLGVLKGLISGRELSPRHFELETVSMDGWNPVAASLENGTCDAACILAPLAMDIFHFGSPLKIVLLTHKNGSSFVRNAGRASSSSPEDFYRESSFLIPHKMSVQNMLSHLFLKSVGLSPSMEKGDEFNVEFEVVPPVKMPEFLAANDHYSGFMVAEPIGSQAVVSGTARLQFRSSELWENHPCCVLAFHREFLESHPDAVHEFTEMLITAGRHITRNPEQAAETGVSFLDPRETLGIEKGTILDVLTSPGGLSTDDLYPLAADLNAMQEYMAANMNSGSMVDMNMLVDTTFADAAFEKLGMEIPPRDRISGFNMERARNASLKIIGSPGNKNRDPQKSKEGEISRAAGSGKPASDTSQGKNITSSQPASDTSQGKNITSSQPASDTSQGKNITSSQPASDTSQGKNITSSLDGKYLSFLLNGEEYGISIMNIREIIGMIPITHVPRTPKYIKGVINLRGRVLPVMDLRLKFDMPPMEYTDRTCILVVEASGGASGTTHMGVVVDTVSEVLNIREDEIDQSSMNNSGFDDNAILGMARIGDRVTILLKIEDVLASSK
ncbi:MAG: chemotaxis protein CheW [Desulfamplus sp.]|nr:chemotaxis protein CheW [Desulfamplus sp.]